VLSYWAQGATTRKGRLLLSEERDTAEHAEKALAAMSSSPPMADHIEALRAARMAAQGSVATGERPSA
jgi:hypothetical protein